MGSVFGVDSGSFLLQVSSSRATSCSVDGEQEVSAGLHPAGPPGSVPVCLSVCLSSVIHSKLNQDQYSIITDTTSVNVYVFRGQRSCVQQLWGAGAERRGGGQRSQQYVSIQDQPTWRILQTAAAWKLQLHSKQHSDTVTSSGRLQSYSSYYKTFFFRLVCICSLTLR